MGTTALLAAKAIAIKAKVPAARVHDLRHAHASWLLLSGLPVKVVSERLGHAKASITLDVYAHLLPGSQDAAVETTSDLLFRREA